MAGKKRTKAQIEHGKALITELTLKQYTQSEIIDILEQETGIRLSQQQVSYDLQKVKKEWLKSTHENYNYLMQRELARVDALEAEIWHAMRDSVKGKAKSVIEQARRKVSEASDEQDEAEYEMVIVKTQEILEENSVNPSYFAQIQACQQERRKLLGLYAPQQIGVQKTIVVKGYKKVSPDDWPDVIEGEIVK